MKRWFIGLTACLIAAVGLSQESNEKQDVSVEKNGGTVAISSGVTPYSGTPVLGDLICFDGTNWVSLAAGTTGKFLQANTGACPTYETLPAAGGAVNLQASSPGTPDTGNWNITGVGTSTHDNIHATLTPGLFLSNTQAALVGEQQEYSPSLKLCGAAWNAASETDCWQIFNRPIAGNPTTEELSFQASLAGAAYVERMKVNSAGKLTLGEATATDGQITLNGATSGSITVVPATGALGTKTLTLPAVNGTVLTDSGATAATAPMSDGSTVSFQTVPYDLTKWSIINTDFYQRSSAAGATVVNNFNISVAGTSAGALYTNQAYNGDSNHPNFIEITTGTTTSGGATLGWGTAGSSTGTSGTILSGGEVLDWLIYVPAASGGTNTFKISVGFMETAGSTAPSNGIFFYWDNNADTHWGIDSVKAGVHSGPTLSNTVATAAAWHHLKIVGNAGGTSYAMYVDGVELNVSPITTQIPLIGVFPSVKILASAGCATANLCVVDVNTVYFRKPVTR